MEAIVAGVVGLMIACGVYLLLRSRVFTVILGVMLLSYGVNLFLLAMGRLTTGLPPIIEAQAEGYADPVPQALVLTAIVIGFAMIAFLLVLALRVHSETGNDHVDGEERP
jgi:multicomponent K+:H+ antiporter subunit C